MIDAFQTVRRGACVAALVAACPACGGGASDAARSCGDARGVPYLVDVPGGYVGGGWYDPGDRWPAPGDDSSAPGDDSQSGDTASSGDDDSSGDPAGSGDDSSGDDSGGEGADATRVHAQNAAQSVRAQRFDGDVCYSCPILCTLSTSPPIAGSAIGSSRDGLAQACARAESDVRHWAHEKLAARITSCRIVDVAP